MQAVYKDNNYYDISWFPQVSEVVRFELDSEKLSRLLSQVEEIQKAVDSHMHT